MCQRKRRIGLKYHLESWWTLFVLRQGSPGWPGDQYVFWDRLPEINVSAFQVPQWRSSPPAPHLVTMLIRRNNACQHTGSTRKKRKSNALSGTKPRKRHVVWPRACAECWMFRPQDSLLTERPVTDICNCSLFPPQQVSDYRGSKRHWTLPLPSQMTYHADFLRSHMAILSGSCSIAVSTEVAW